MIFDGRAFAREIEQQVNYKVRNLVKKPRIVSVLVGDDPSSELYTRLKKQAAERVGIVFEVVRLESGFSSDQNQGLGSRIKEIGEREDVTGVMVQLPLPGVSRKDTQEIVQVIPLEKDVDGLRWEESGIKPATVRGILSIVDEIATGKTKFVVLGSRGAVGLPLTHFLREMGKEVIEVESDTPEPTRRVLVGEVVISCVGKAGLVTEEMVRDGVVAIDVGMSEVEGKVVGDMTQGVYDKASMAVPVPGGVGPVTIASLMRNAWELADKSGTGK